MSNAINAAPALNLREQNKLKPALITILGCLVVSIAVYHLLLGRKQHQPPEGDLLSINFQTREAESTFEDIFTRPDSWFWGENGRILLAYMSLTRGYRLVGFVIRKGGFWSTELGPVDLEFLGLDRFKDTPKSNNSDEEDKFCNKLRKLGPSWHENEAWYRYDISGCEDLLAFPIELLPRRRRGPKVFYGYPSTGSLWVYKLVHEKEKARIAIGKFSNVLNMDERSKVIEMFGGTFYSDPEKYLKENQAMPEDREKQLFAQKREL